MTQELRGPESRGPKTENIQGTYGEKTIRSSTTAHTLLTEWMVNDKYHSHQIKVH